MNLALASLDAPRPYTGVPTARLNLHFRAGSLAGDYTLTFRRQRLRDASARPVTTGPFLRLELLLRPRGQIIAQASDSEDEVLVADLDLAMIDEVRTTWQFSATAVPRPTVSCRTRHRRRS